jgi:hypothetical protein
MSEVLLSVRVGNDTQSVKLTEDEWCAAQSGGYLVKEGRGFYEGEVFTYEWHFNDPRFPGTNLVVLYADAEGFIGSIQDAMVVRQAPGS